MATPGCTEHLVQCDQWQSNSPRITTLGTTNLTYCPSPTSAQPWSTQLCDILLKSWPHSCHDGYSIWAQPKQELNLAGQKHELNGILHFTVKHFLQNQDTYALHGPTLARSFGGSQSPARHYEQGGKLLKKEGLRELGKLLGRGEGKKRVACGMGCFTWTIG
jgi:hypothetical protein